MIKQMDSSPQSTGFDPNVFPQYGRLTRGERIFLRTCCYFPPRPRRVRTLANVKNTEQYAMVYERAFGPKLWPLIAGKHVLDFGCGEGGYVLALGENGAGQAVGLDILPDFHFAQQEAAERGHDHVRFISASSESLPDASFDVIISHDSFEHFERPEVILAEMVRLARPGGRLLIKFGPPWRNPWGRHLTGTIRRDRPWVHLLVPERTVMRCHSVYHNDAALFERYADVIGGLNKMTVGRFQQMLKKQAGIRIEEFKVFPLYGLPGVSAIPVLKEFFASGVRTVCVRN